MTDTTLGSQTKPVVPRLGRYLWAPAIVLALLGVLGTGFYLGKHLLMAEADVVELPARSVNSIARLPDSAPIVAISDNAATTSASDPSGKLVFGQPAPDFSLKTADGKTVRLSDFKGHPVLINFWATWCAPCKFEMPALESIYQKYKDKGLVILAVDIKTDNGEAAVRKYQQDMGLSFPVVMDTTGETENNYRVRAYPTSFFIGKDGKLREVKRGAFMSADQIAASVDKIVN